MEEKTTGHEILRQIVKWIKSKSKIQVHLNTKITKLFHTTNPDQNRFLVTGVEYTNNSNNCEDCTDDEDSNPREGQTGTLFADSVVITTGGFVRNHKLLAQYGPTLSHLPTTNGPWAEGDAINLLQDLNAVFIQMDQIEVHPTAIIDPISPNSPIKWHCPEELRLLGSLLIDENGERFTNEIGPEGEVAKAVMSRSEQKKLYLVFNEEIASHFKFSQFFVRRFLATKYDNMTDMCEELKMDENMLHKTINHYDLIALKKNETERVDEFGRKVFPVLFSVKDSFYAIQITPALHYTSGGLKIDKLARVYSNSDGTEKIIDGLFAAGEVVGGIHGSHRLPGNALLDCVVYGRQAGKSASLFNTPAKKHIEL